MEGHCSRGGLFRRNYQHVAYREHCERFARRCAMIARSTSPTSPPSRVTAPILGLDGKRYTFVFVPAGSRVGYCRGPNCRRPIYWVSAANGGKHPIDCNVVGGELPSINAPGQIDAFVESEETRGAPAHDGRGVLHQHVCTDVALFAKEKRDRMVRP